MGCGHSSVKVESNITSNLEKKQNSSPNKQNDGNELNKKENQTVLEQKHNIDKKPENQNQNKATENYSSPKENLNNDNYLYCYNGEEIKKIINLLKEKQFKPNDIIYHKTLVEIRKDFTYYKEYKTILTDKIDGEILKSNYKFISSTITDIPENYSIKINNKEIDIKTSKISQPIVQYFIECSFPFNLSSEEKSIVTFEINVKIKTNVYHTLLRVYFTFQKCPFSFFIFCHNEFYFISTSSSPFNKLVKISPQKILLFGEKHENYLIFAFKQKGSYIQLPRQDKAFYYCNEEELINLEKSLNTIELQFKEMNIIGVKDIYNIKEGICFAKTYVTFFRPSEGVDCPGGIYIYDLDEYDDLKFINSKDNNKQANMKIFTPESFIGKKYLNFHYSLEEREYFCTIEIDYSFKIKYGKTCYIMNIGHDQIPEGGYFQFIVHFDENIKYFKFPRNTRYFTNVPEYHIKIDTFYKHVNDNYPYNGLFFK